MEHKRTDPFRVQKKNNFKLPKTTATIARKSENT